MAPSSRPGLRTYSKRIRSDESSLKPAKRRLVESTPDPPNFSSIKDDAPNKPSTEREANISRSQSSPQHNATLASGSGLGDRNALLHSNTASSEDPQAGSQEKRVQTAPIGASEPAAYDQDPVTSILTRSSAPANSSPPSSPTTTKRRKLDASESTQSSPHAKYRDRGLDDLGTTPVQTSSSNSESGSTGIQTSSRDQTSRKSSTLQDSTIASFFQRPTPGHFTSEKRKEPHEDPIVNTPASPKLKKRSIFDYFRSIPASSSPPTSPSSRLFSDPIEKTISSPPSSPLHREDPESPAFGDIPRPSTRKKRRLTSRPTLDVAEKINISAEATSLDANEDMAFPKSSRGVRPPPVQTTLNLGRPDQPRTCPVCHLVYRRFHPQDEEAHRIEHQLHVEGPTIYPRDFPTKFYSNKPLYKSFIATIDIVRVDSDSRPWWKDMAMKFQELADRDLNAEPIKYLAAWQRKFFPTDDDIPAESAYLKRYAFFLGVINRSIAGMLLVERTPSTVSRPYGGFSVDKIWTQKKHRKIGVATALLDYAREAGIFFDESVLPGEIEFTQTTKIGDVFRKNYITRAGKAL